MGKGEKGGGGGGGGEGRREGREPVEKLLTPPFQLTSCAPDSGASPDWLDH